MVGLVDVDRTALRGQLAGSRRERVPASQEAFWSPRDECRTACSWPNTDALNRAIALTGRRDERSASGQTATSPLIEGMTASILGPDNRIAGGGAFTGEFGLQKGRKPKRCNRLWSMVHDSPAPERRTPNSKGHIWNGSCQQISRQARIWSKRNFKCAGGGYCCCCFKRAVRVAGRRRQD